MPNPHLRTLPLSLTVLAFAGGAALGGVELKTNEQTQTVEVTIRGEHFTTYHYGDSRHVPFLWPVNAQGGIGVTRNYPMGTDDPAVEDHPHHLSLYLTYGTLNGYDFWHVGRGKSGVIRTVDVKTGDADGFSWIRAHHHWVARDGGKLVMEELRELRFHDAPPSARVFDLITTFKATAGDVTFGDTKEGMLAVRMRPEIDGDHGGILTNAHGRQGEAAVYGRPSPWMDYTGEAKGHGKRGVAIFDHPDNFRRGQWHVRDYGLASINPFASRSVARLEDGSHTIRNGDSLTLRYRFLIHSGSHEDANVGACHALYIADKSILQPIE